MLILVIVEEEQNISFICTTTNTVKVYVNMEKKFRDAQISDECIHTYNLAQLPTACCMKGIKDFIRFLEP